MNFYEKLEKKFGRFAVKNITLYLIAFYIAGYIINYINPSFLNYLTLDAYKIIHGQVWRLISWLLIPPEGDNIFLIFIMLIFYYSIGTALESAWGKFQYNLYLFSGMIFTIIGSFLMLLFCTLKYKTGIMVQGTNGIELISGGAVSSYLSVIFSTYYINMSIFLAYACTFPDSQVLLMFLIPIKVKWLGVVYGAYIIYDMLEGMKSLGNFGFVFPFVIGSSLMNFLVFVLTSRKYILGKRKRTRAQRAYNTQTRDFEKFKREKENNITRHKCAICGRTEKDGEDLVFRFCSKCDGNYEYCQDHLYTHIHFTKTDD